MPNEKATTSKPAAAKPKAAAAEPDPAPDTMAVLMANATHGAVNPGDVVTVPVEVGRALIQAGEARPA
jgi:hypothetical protein